MNSRDNMKATDNEQTSAGQTVIAGSTSYTQRWRVHRLGKRGLIIVCIIAATLLAAIGYMVFIANQSQNTTPQPEPEPTNSIERQINLSTDELANAKTDEEKITALLFLAGDYLASGNTDEAINYYLEVLEIDAQQAQAIGGLITCYRAKQDATNASKYIGDMIRILKAASQPDQDAIAYYETMLKQVQGGDFSEVKNSGQADPGASA